MRRKLIIIASITIVGASAAAAATLVWTWTTRPAKATGPAYAAQVPSVIPADGVVVGPRTERITLMPATDVDPSSLKLSSTSDAMAVYNDDTPTSPVAVLARVTVGSSLPVQGDSSNFSPIADRVCWVLSYTYPKPVDISWLAQKSTSTSSTSASPSPIWVTHDNVIIDANTGDFLLGWND